MQATHRVIAGASSVVLSSRTHPRWSRYIVYCVHGITRHTTKPISQHFTETHLQIQESDDSTMVDLLFLRRCDKILKMPLSTGRNFYDSLAKPHESTPRPSFSGS